MKIQRYNEAKTVKKPNTLEFDNRSISNLLSVFVEDDHKLQKALKAEIERIMVENGDDIIFDDAVYILDPKADEPTIAYIDKINKFGDLFEENDHDESVFSIYKIFHTSDLISILEYILQYSNKTYKYQKFIIENKPKDIGTIIDKLNAKILLEYPHLASGQDLGLLNK